MHFDLKETVFPTASIPPIAIREYRDADIPSLAHLYHDTVMHVNARDYTPEQIAAWSPGVWPGEFWRERFESAYRVFVAELDGAQAGFAEFYADGHIDAFYVHHEHQGKGIGRRLMQRIEEEARRTGLDRLHLEASVTGRPRFAAMGFAVTRETVKEYRGAVFQQTFMEKRLTAANTMDTTR